MQTLLDTTCSALKYPLASIADGRFNGSTSTACIHSLWRVPTPPCLSSALLSSMMLGFPTTPPHGLIVNDTPALAATGPVDCNGLTPLCLACNLGLDKVVIALLDGGADIDFATPPGHACSGFTPLMYATSGDHGDVVKLLLKHGVDGTKYNTQVGRCRLTQIQRH